jgi:uncharacterized coiled-coil DUF342 family protein
MMSMKYKYTAIAELQEASSHIKNQLISLERWSSQLNQRLVSLHNAFDNDIVTLEELPEKISILRGSLYEIDKAMEILSTNCFAISQTLNKEDNGQARDTNSLKQTDGLSEEQGNRSKV